MATVFESLPLDGLRVAHLQQLMCYLEEAEGEGWYYGPKAHFDARHRELKEWLQSALDYARSEGVKMPRKKKGSNQ